MVAHTVTTSASRATGCDVGGSASAPNSPSPASPSAPLPLSPSAPSLPSPSVPSPLRPSAPSASDLPGADFPTVPAHLHNRILSDLCHPGSSLISVARDNGVDLAVLAMWLTEPETREKMLAIEKGGYAHTRMAASVTLASTVNVLHTIIQDYTEAHAHARQLRAHERLAPVASRHDPLPPSHFNAHPDRSFLPGEAILADTSLQAQRLELRRAEGVRRASLHLYRLSRIVPVDDSKLALAASHRTANVSERISSDSDGHATGCLSASANNGEVRNDDANSTRVACLHEVQACSEDLSASATTDGPHGCSVGGAAMPPDQYTTPSPSTPSDFSSLRPSALSETSAFSSPSPSSPVPLSPSAPLPLSSRSPPAPRRVEFSSPQSDSLRGLRGEPLCSRLRAARGE
jgi:hypothetical protein